MWMETQKNNQTEKIREHEFYRISRRILVVAVKGAVDDWAAYVGIVDGGAEDNWLFVWRNGTKIRYELAKVMFPNFSKKYNWRS